MTVPIGLRALVLALLLAFVALGGAAAQNPFGTKPGATPAPPPAASAAPAAPPSLFSRAVRQITIWQRQLNETLAAEIRAYKETGSLTPVFAILLISFLYGVFHAIGPGHGKVVTASYFAANRAKVIEGFTLSFMISTVQAISAIVIVGGLALIFGFGPTRVVQNVTYVEAASDVLIVAVGLWIAFAGLTGRTHNHDHGHGHGDDHGHDHAHHGHGDAHYGHDHHGHRHGPGHAHAAAPRRRSRVWTMTGAAIASGIRPCTGAILVLLFTLAQGIFFVGVLGAFVMSLGVFLMLALLSIATIYIRRAVASTGHARPGLAAFAHRAAGTLGGLVIAAFGILLLFGSLERLGFVL